MNDEPLEYGWPREQNALGEQMLFSLLKEGFWQRPTACLLRNPEFEL